MIRKILHKGNKMSRRVLSILLTFAMLSGEIYSLVQSAYAAASVDTSSIEMTVNIGKDKGDGTGVKADSLKYYNFKSTGNYYSDYSIGNLDDNDGWCTPYFKKNSTTDSTSSSLTSKGSIRIGMEGQWGDAKYSTQAGLVTFSVSVKVPANTMYYISYQMDGELWGDCTNALDSLVVAEGYCNDSMSSVDGTSSDYVYNSSFGSISTTSGASIGNIFTIWRDNDSGGDDNRKSGQNWGGTAYEGSGKTQTYKFNNLTGSSEKTFTRYFVMLVSQADGEKHTDNKICGETVISVNSCLSYSRSDFISVSDIFKNIGSAQDANTAMKDLYDWEYPSTENSTTGTLSEASVYALQVATGNNDGTNIEYFEIRYLSSDGNYYSQYVFPQSEYSSSLAWANKVASQEDNIKTAEEVGLDKSAWQQTSKGAMSSMSTDLYVTYLRHDLSQVESITVHGGGSVYWSCMGIKFYKIIECYGMSMYSYATRDTYVDFKGLLLAEADIALNSKGQHSEVISLSNTQDCVFGNATYTPDYQKELKAYPLDYESRARSIFTGKDSDEDATDGYVTRKSYTSKAAYLAEVLYDTHQQYDYLVKIDVADAFGAGLEAYAMMFGRDNISLASTDAFEEILALTVLYEDIFGYSHQIFIPVTINALAFIKDTYGSSFKIHGIAQQGDEICMKCRFPYLKSVSSVMISYGQKTVTTALTSSSSTIRVKANTITDTELEGGASWKTRSDVTNGTGDSFSFSGISITQYSPNSLKADVQSGRMTYKCTKSDETGKVISYYKSNTLEGDTMNVESNEEIQMTAYENGASTDVSRKQLNTYLIEFKTDSVQQAGSVNDIDITFRYENLAGEEIETEAYSFREGCEGYYGWWPATSGKLIPASSMKSADYTSDGAFVYAMNPGNSGYIILNINNLKRFTGFTIHMADNANLDEYQVGEINFYILEELGELSVSFLSPQQTIGSAKLDRIIKRTNNKLTLLDSRNSAAIMVLPGESVSVDMDGTETDTISVSEENNDVGDVEYLSYMGAQQITGSYLRKVRTSYTVTVTVAGDDYYSIAEGDTGSKNQFYFQLLFKDGNTIHTSSYVNANSQLASDRFRGGCSETFTIECNADYGDVYAIRIIPDDLSSNSDETDKLCIEKISVSKSGQAGLGYTYETAIAEDEMWVNVPFQDDEAEQTGRSEEELQTIYYIADVKMNVKLEFALLTGSLIPTGESDNGSYGQFQGTLTANIKYKTWSGNTKSVDVDVVKEIQKYAGHSTAASSSTETYKVSDPSYMFIPGVTNRFTLEFEDAASLESITFTAKNTTDKTVGLSIQQISVRQVAEEGVLRLVRVSDTNDFGEYMRYYSSGKSFNICTQASSEAMPKQIVIGAGAEQSSKAIKFTAGNEIRKLADDGVAVQEAEEDPSINDTMNVVMVAKGTTLYDGDKANVKIVYKDKYSSIHEAEGAVYYDAVQGAFTCRTGSVFGASMFCMPIKVEVSCQKPITVTTMTLSQMRDNEGVSSYSQFSIDASGVTCSTDAENPTTIDYNVSADSGTYYDYYTQKLYVEFDSTTKEQEITKDKDILISFRYLRNSDQEVMYFTSGDMSLYGQGITKIGPRMVIELDFQADDVKSIEMVRLKKTSDDMESVSVRNISLGQKVRSKTSTGDFAYTYGWFNCSTIGQVGTTSYKSFTPTESTLALGASSTSRLSPVMVTVKTAEDDATTGLKSGTDNDVNVTVTYINNSGVIVTSEAINIQDILTSGSLESGQEATFGLLISDMRQILQIAFTPVDSGTGVYGTGTNIAGAWKVEKVTVSGSQGTTCTEFEVSKDVNGWAKGGDSLSVNVSNMLIKCSVSLTEIDAIKNTVGTATSLEDLPAGSVFDNTERKSYAASVPEITLNALVVTTDSTAKTDNWNYKIQRVNGDAVGDEITSGVVGTSINYTLSNTGKTDATYRLTVYATDSVKAEFDIVIPAGS